jgi:Ca2+-binding EF-hand superfamily protein
MKSAYWLAIVVFAVGVVQVPREAASENTFHFPMPEMFKKLDVNGDNRLSEKEFVGERGGAARAKARKLFRRLDENNDQWLTMKELRNK